jgi:TonB family protein
MHIPAREFKLIVISLRTIILFYSCLFLQLNIAVAETKEAVENTDHSEQLALALSAFENGDYAKTHAILLPLSLNKNTKALTWLGLMHELGLGVDLDDILSELYLRQATVRGDVAAARYMAWKFSDSAKPIEKNAAAARYRVLAEKNLAADPNVTKKIGWMTTVAEEFTQNYDRVLNWNEEQAVSINKIAYYNLGMLHAMGRGVARNHKKAVSWWEKAAELDHPLALWRLGLYHEKEGTGKQNLKKAIAYYERAATLGYRPAVEQLIDILESDKGFDAETEKALLWNRQAAIQGDAKAQSNLGFWYESGINIEQDFNQAIHWYSYAAEQKDTRALTLLGRAYILGRGVKADYEKGLKLLTEAGEQGSSLAKYLLGHIYKKGLGVEVDENLALAYYQEASNLGYAKAQLLLSEYYFLGLAIDQDIEKALELLRTSAAQDYHRAEMRLAHWYYKGIAVEQDDELFYYWVIRSAEHGSRVGDGILAALDETKDDMHTTVDKFWERAKSYSHRKNYLKQQREDYVRGSIKYKPPRPVNVIQPELPKNILDTITKGRVLLRLQVSKRGYVTNIEVEESTHVELEEPTLRAVKQWRFAPSLRDGKPAMGLVRIPIVYN